MALTIDLEAVEKLSMLLKDIDLTQVEEQKNVASVLVMEKNKMLDQNEVAQLTKVSKMTVTAWREQGLLRFMKTGNRYVTSQNEFQRFQERFLGMDISNLIKMREALEATK